MSWRYLDRVEGIAIDNENTYAHHQLMSVNRQDNILHYTVFYEPFDIKGKKDVPDDFISAMEIRSLKSQEDYRQISRLYSAFSSAIRPCGRKRGFEMHEVAKALTFDIEFNQHYQMVGMSYRPTLGYMTKKMSCRDAAKHMTRSQDLKLMHDVGLNSSPRRKDRHADIISFENVISNIGVWVQQQKLCLDFFENMDCIFRQDADFNMGIYERQEINGLSNTKWVEYFTRYHSVRDHVAKGKGKKIPQGAVVPTTASRDMVDHYNIMATAETMVTGASPFADGVTKAVTQYYRHRLVAQRMGFTG